MKLKFREYCCKTLWQHYAAGNTALRLALESGEPLTTASVNVPGVKEGEIAIKDWTENQGMLDCLVEAGLVEPPHRAIPVGFCSALVCRLTEAAYTDGAPRPESV